jgi:transposase
MKPINSDKKDSILALLHQGKTRRDIAQQVGVCNSTVSFYAKQHDVESSNMPGRKRKISTVLGRAILRSFNSGEVHNAVEAQKAFSKEVTVNPQTIRNMLHECKFKAKIKPDALPLTPTRKRNRLRFAKKYQHWTEDDWKRVVFSDETKINRLGSDGKQYTWVQGKRPLQDHNTNQKYKHGGGSLFLWGCITSHGQGFICQIEGGLDAALYCDILNDDFISTLNYYGIDRSKVVFQQDNDPKHTSKKAKAWFQKNKIELLDWPPYSPDLNPIENMWYYLKCQLAKYETQATSIYHLWERVQEVWERDDVKSLSMKVIDSMPRRIQAVIKAKGGETKW